MQGSIKVKAIGSRLWTASPRLHPCFPLLGGHGLTAVSSGFL